MPNNGSEGRRQCGMFASWRHRGGLDASFKLLGRGHQPRYNRQIYIGIAEKRENEQAPVNPSIRGIQSMSAPGPKPEASAVAPTKDGMTSG